MSPSQIFFKCKENGGVGLTTLEVCMGQKEEILSPDEPSPPMNKSLLCEAFRLSLYRCWNFQRVAWMKRYDLFQ